MLRRIDELDAARTHQEQVLSLAEEARDTELQARIRIALSASYQGERAPAA